MKRELLKGKKRKPPKDELSVAEVDIAYCSEQARIKFYKYLDELEQRYLAQKRRR